MVYHCAKGIGAAVYKCCGFESCWEL